MSYGLIVANTGDPRCSRHQHVYSTQDAHSSPGVTARCSWCPYSLAWLHRPQHSNHINRIHVPIVSKRCKNILVVSALVQLIGILCSCMHTCSTHDAHGVPGGMGACSRNAKVPELPKLP